MCKALGSISSTTKRKRKEIVISQVAYTPVIPALSILTLEDYEFKSSLDCTARTCPK
jgi:hypothetical protein